MSRVRLLRSVAFAVALVLPVEASARETAALHDGDSEDVADIEEEAFGTRGLVVTRAETVSFDAKARSIELAGNVRVDSPPFHLRSDHVVLSRTKYGIEAAGKGTLAFCPCLGTPLTIEFEKAIVAPPGELILASPKLEIYGVPVLYLPWFWLRSNEKLGLLPPDVAYRGQDGFYLGGGVHVPWKERGSLRTLDLRGGGYVDGGFVADVRLLTAASSTKIRFDRLASGVAPVLPMPGADEGSADDGLLVDARGATRDEAAAFAWDVDVLRGRRGVASTTDLDAAARPWDRATFSGSVGLGPVRAETGARAVTRRGGDLVAASAAGPFVALRSSGAISPALTYDVTVEGGSLRLAGEALDSTATRTPAIAPDALTYGRADVGILGATTLGPFALSATGRAAGDVAVEGRRTGGDRAATARLRVGLPLARGFGGGATDPDSPNDSLVHVVDPFVEASVLHSSGNQILASLPGRGIASVAGTAPVAEAGVRTALGRWGKRDALELTLAGGTSAGADVAPSGLAPLARSRLAATFDAFGGQVETAHVGGNGAAGNAVVARSRLGQSDGLRLLANVAVRTGLEPVLARALTEASLESPAGFLAREGTTGGASVAVPWARALTTIAGADADLTRTELVAARAGIELRDRCNCVLLRANGSHRIGRSGVDVWVTIDFVAGR